MNPNPDFSDLLSTFNALEVRYLVVGGYALAFHAEPRFTKDLDLWIEPEEENADRAWQALADFGAPLADLRREDLAKPGTIFQLGVPPNRIDVLTAVDGLAFSGAWHARVEARYGDVRIHVLSREDLIRNKRAVGRAQDLADVEALERGPEAPPSR